MWGKLSAQLPKLGMHSRLHTLYSGCGACSECCCCCAWPYSLTMGMECSGGCASGPAAAYPAICAGRTHHDAGGGWCCMHRA